MKRAIPLLAFATMAQAQVSVRGLAYDSIHGKPLAGALIGVLGTTTSAISDSAGRFLIAPVARGTLRIAMQHDVLDAIGLPAVGVRVTVNGHEDSIVVAVPSFSTLWRAACGSEPPRGRDTGFVFGTVGGAGPTTTPATIAATWLKLTGSDGQRELLMEVSADSGGSYALCGVPTTTGLRLRASRGPLLGSWIAATPVGNDRIARWDLAISAIASRRQSSATAIVTGQAREEPGSRVIPGVEISLLELGLSTTSDENGRFVIPKVLAGSRALRARKPGYASVDLRLEVEEGETTTATVVMNRVTTLDSVKIVDRATRDEPMRVFEEHRKIGLGRFITRAELEQQKNRRMSEIIGQFPGVLILRGTSGQAYLGSRNGVKSLQPPKCELLRQDDPIDSRKSFRPCPEACYARLFLDGVEISRGEMPNINRIDPAQLEAVEYYSGAAQMPVEYNILNAHCGALILHTRRAGAAINRPPLA